VCYHVPAETKDRDGEFDEDSLVVVAQPLRISSLHDPTSIAAGGFNDRFAATIVHYDLFVLNLSSSSFSAEGANEDARMTLLMSLLEGYGTLRLPKCLKT
jgi:hypothetical protein